MKNSENGSKHKQKFITEFYSRSPAKKHKLDEPKTGTTAESSKKGTSKSPLNSGPKKSPKSKISPRPPPPPFFDEKTAVSQAKHVVLSQYIGAWLPILYNNKERTKVPDCPQYTRIVYVDGFAGPGIYEDGKNGSPAMIYQLAVNHKLIKGDGPQICFIFVEVDKGLCDKLWENLRRLKEENKDKENVNKVRCMIINGAFADAMEWILSEHFVFEQYSEEKVHPVNTTMEEPTSTAVEKFIGEKTPLLVFIDPFGYNGKQMPMALNKKIMSTTTKSEILVNLMTGPLRRRIGLDKSEKSEKQYNLLLGDNAKDNRWKSFVLEGKDGKEKIQRFLHYYNRQVSEGCANGPLHNCLFEMNNEKNSLLYHLYFAAHHKKAFTEMKDAMGRASQNEAVFKFSAFEEKKPDFKRIPILPPELMEFLIYHFEGKKVFGWEITEFMEKDSVLTQKHRTQLKKSLQKYCVEENSKFDGMLFDFSSVEGSSAQ